MLRYLRNRQGWIFIDALIGMVIVALALTSLVMAYFQATSAAVSSNNYLRAVYIAQAELEDLKQYDRQPPGTITLPPLRQAEMEGSPQQFTVRVEQIAVAAVDALDLRLVPVRVTVTWREANGAAGQVQLTGYYYQLERTTT